MNSIHLPTLDIVFETEAHVYHDEGIVPDLVEHARALCRKHGLESLFDPTSIRPETTGFHLGLKHASEQIMSHYTFILDKNPFTNLTLRAHEETHVLHMAGGIEKMAQRLDSRDLHAVADALREYQDFGAVSEYQLEFVANIGCLEALENQGYDVLYQSMQSPHEVVHDALKFYKTAIRQRNKSYAARDALSAARACNPNAPSGRLVTAFF